MGSMVRWAHLGLAITVVACLTQAAAAPSFIPARETASAAPGNPVRGTSATIDVAAPPSIEYRRVATLDDAPAASRVAFDTPATLSLTSLESFSPPVETRMASVADQLFAHLPQPGAGTTILATLALAAFFFLRRLTR